MGGVAGPGRDLVGGRGGGGGGGDGRRCRRREAGEDEGDGDGRQRVAVVVVDGLGSHHHVVGEARGERARRRVRPSPLSSRCHHVVRYKKEWAGTGAVVVVVRWMRWMRWMGGRGRDLVVVRWMRMREDEVDWLFGPEQGHVRIS